MKVLYCGDAAVSSGFARCTHAVCDALTEAGHEVHVLGINYYGDPHTYPYPIYTCQNPLDMGRDAFGVTRLPGLIYRLRPDVVVLQNDPWNIPVYLQEMKSQLPEDFQMPPVVGFVAVDAKNQKASGLNGLAHVAVWTEFAKRELAAGGYKGETTVIPLGVSPKFHPIEKRIARRAAMPHGLPENAFVIGVVGRNQIRKRLDLSIEYFAKWVKSRDIKDAYLYLHIGPTGDVGADIRSLVFYHGVQTRVILAEPRIGTGIDEQAMACMYSSLDLYFSTSQGEGWGLPALEAMACGTPCLVPKWSGLESWASLAAGMIECDGTALTAPMNGLAYTIGGIPSREETLRWLNNLYDNRNNLAMLSESGLQLARTFPWSLTGETFVKMLEEKFGGS